MASTPSYGSKGYNPYFACNNISLFWQAYFLVDRLTGSDAIAMVNWQLCLITLINIFNTICVQHNL